MTSLIGIPTDQRLVAVMPNPMSVVFNLQHETIATGTVVWVSPHRGFQSLGQQIRVIVRRSFRLSSVGQMDPAFGENVRRAFANGFLEPDHLVYHGAHAPDISPSRRFHLRRHPDRSSSVAGKVRIFVAGCAAEISELEGRISLSGVGWSAQQDVIWLDVAMENGFPFGLVGAIILESVVTEGQRFGEIDENVPNEGFRYHYAGAGCVAIGFLVRADELVEAAEVAILDVDVGVSVVREGVPNVGKDAGLHILLERVENVDLALRILVISSFFHSHKLFQLEIFG